MKTHTSRLEGLFVWIVLLLAGMGAAQGQTAPAITTQPVSATANASATPAVVAAAAGDYHTLYVMADGTLWAVGRNGEGRLGDGTTTTRTTPVQIATDVQSVAANGWHSLFIKTDGTLWAMGANNYGQLGDGTTTTRTRPVLVATGVLSAAANANNSMFVKTDGTLWGMGYNGNGQLGDGMFTTRTSPVQIATGVRSVAMGAYHSLFVKTDNTLWGLGANGYGQLGDGTTTDARTPVQIATGVQLAEGGDQHSLFIKTDGTLWAVGSNGYGQLGNGTTTSRTSPVQVATGVQAIVAGGHHSLFVKTDGTAWATGYNESSQLGDGTTTERHTWVQVATGVQSVAAGYYFSLFVKTDGTLWGVGENRDGELGTGSTAAVVSTPVPVGGTSLSVTATGTAPLSYQWRKDGVDIDKANAATLVLARPKAADAGSYTVVVSNATGNVTSSAATVTVNVAPVITVQPVAQTVTALGQSASFSVTATGTAPLSYQWRLDGVAIAGATAATYSIGSVQNSNAGLYTVIVSNAAGSATGNAVLLTVPPAITTQPTPTSVVVPGSPVVVAAAVGYRPSHTLYLAADGTLWAVGYNFSGQLGDGTTTDRSSPVRVATSVQAVAAGIDHSLFVKTDGTLWAMGENQYGQLGDGTATRSTSPVLVATGVQSVTTNRYDSLFVKTDGTLWGMGQNYSGALGDGTTTQRNAPVQIATGVRAAASGAMHSLFVKTDGTLWAMGLNSNNQLGDGTTTDRHTPLQIATNVQSATAGDAHSLFVKKDGTLWGMGFNGYGQLGDGTTSQQATPVQVATGVESTAAGEGHSLFVKTDGTLWAMGFNENGQLGDGTTTNRSTPVQVATGVQSAAAGGYNSLFVMTDGTLWGMGNNVYGQLGIGTTAETVSIPVPVGGVILSVAATGTAPLSYQWRNNGVPIAGATSATLMIASPRPSDAGSYTVVVSNVANSATSNAAAVAVEVATARMVNLSVRSAAGSGSQTLIVGFVITGSGSKQLLLRGIGPTLGSYGVSNALADPLLRLFNSSGVQVQANDDWGGSAELNTAFASLGAFALPAASKDAALFTPLAAGPSTFHIVANSGTGVALAELYDADSAAETAQLVNISARTQVDTGDKILIAGFVITGNVPKTVLIRGLGPTLTPYGVTGALADPQLKLYKGGAIVTSNDDWGGTTVLKSVFANVGAVGLVSDTSKDAAMLVTLPPGAYSAQVSGVNSTTGVGLVEVFVVP